MSKRIFSTFIMSLAASQAHAVIVSGYGAEAWTSTASNCPSYCTSAGGGQFAYDGAGGEYSSTAYSSESSYADTRAYVSLAGASYLPILRVEASADVGRGGEASAMGVQGFTYSGAASTTLTLNMNLHGSVGVGDSNFYQRNVLEAGVAVFVGSQINFYGGFGTMVYENILPPTDVTQMFISSGTNQNVFDSISFDIDPGQDFFVLGYMNASSKNGYADAWNTLTMSFEDDTGLTAVETSAVPVPAAAWLFASGLLGMVGVARRTA